MKTRGGEIIPPPIPPPQDNRGEKSKASRGSLRNKEHFLIGKSAKMSSNMLPTRADVIKHFWYLKEKREFKFRINALSAVLCRLVTIGIVLIKLFCL